ncbi:MAG: amidase family protein [Polyangia bacterium]
MTSIDDQRASSLAEEDLDAVGLAERVRRGAVSPLELVDAAIRRIERLEPQVNALVSTDFEAARARARALSQGPRPPAGLLAGVPFLLKDLLAYPGQRFTLGSRLFARQVAPAGSPYTERLDAAGLITLGKTTTSELGLLGSTESLLSGVTRNPWSRLHSATGSSGGAAAAVACGMVPMAHASDGGGSIRIPASACGLFGFKPSRGRCAKAAESDLFGLISEHCVSRSVRDSACLLAVTEATQVTQEATASGSAALGFVRGPAPRRLRIAAYSETLLGRKAGSDAQAALRATIALCRDLGHEVHEVDGVAAPRIDGAAISEGFFTLAGAAMAGLADLLTPQLGRPPGEAELEPFTLELIDWYRGLPADALQRTQAVIARESAAMTEFLSRWDVALCPTMPEPPPRLGELAPGVGRAELIRRTEVLAGFTAVHNMAGVPAMSVPLYWNQDGLPIGSHFAAVHGADATLLSLAYELEAARPWWSRRPPLAAR